MVEAALGIKPKLVLPDVDTARSTIGRIVAVRLAISGSAMPTSRGRPSGGAPIARVSAACAEAICASRHPRTSTASAEAARLTKSVTSFDRRNMRRPALLTRPTGARVEFNFLR